MMISHSRIIHECMQGLADLRVIKKMKRKKQKVYLLLRFSLTRDETRVLGVYAYKRHAEKAHHKLLLKNDYLAPKYVYSVISKSVQGTEVIGSIIEEKMMGIVETGQYVQIYNS